MSRHRQWRAWQFARRHRNQDMLGSMMSGNDYDPEKLNAIGRWFKRMGWKGELLKGVLTIAALIVIWECGLIIPFVIVGFLVMVFK